MPRGSRADVTGDPGQLLRQVQVVPVGLPFHRALLEIDLVPVRSRVDPPDRRRDELATVIIVEAVRPAVGFVPTARGAARAVLLAGLAGLVGVGAHLAGGGSLPVGGPAVIGVAGIAAPATFLAQALAARHRTTWRAFVALGCGQLGVELLLQADDRVLEGLLVTAMVHFLANIALGVMVVGADSALADLVVALDRVLPPSSELPLLPVAGDRGPSAGRNARPASRAAIVPRAPRGPPRLLALH